jgi:hypothetical protein
VNVDYRGLFSGYALTEEPGLFSAVEENLNVALGLARESVRSAAEQIVVQSTIVYLNSEAVDFAVERYIPVDLYFDDWNPNRFRRVNRALDLRCKSIGLEYIQYPGVARSSTHGREL